MYIPILRWIHVYIYIYIYIIQEDPVAAGELLASSRLALLELKIHQSGCSGSRV